MRVGVGLWCLQSSALRPRPFPALYSELLEDARHAEAVGLDSLWLSEHHFFYDGYCPALLPAAAAALSVTQRLRVGTGVLLLPLQAADRVARAAAHLAESSGGRFDLGVGAGYREIEYLGKGLEFADRLSRMRAGLDALQGSPAPRWVGVSTPAAARRAGRRGLGLFLSGAFPPTVVRQMIQEHRQAWHQAGEPGEGRPPVGLLRNVWLADDEGARAQALEWARSSYVVYAGLGWSATAAGMDFAAQVDASMQEVVDGAIVGSADEVAEAVAAFPEIDLLVCRIGYDLPPRSAVLEVMERIGTELVPRLASLGAANEQKAPPLPPPQPGPVPIGIAQLVTRNRQGPPAGLPPPPTSNDRRICLELSPAEPLSAGPSGAELSRHDDLDLLVARAIAAENAGIYAVLVGGGPGTETLRAAAVAAHTRWIRIVVRLHLDHEDPVTLAEEIAVLDNLTNGRVMVLADADAGGHDGHDGHNDLALLRAALQGQEVRGVTISPPPVQPALEIWRVGEEPLARLGWQGDPIDLARRGAPPVVAALAERFLRSEGAHVDQ